MILVTVYTATTCWLNWEPRVRKKVNAASLLADLKSWSRENLFENRYWEQRSGGKRSRIWHKIDVDDIGDFDEFWAIIDYSSKPENKISRKHAVGVRESEKYNVEQLQADLLWPDSADYVTVAQ